MQKPQSDSSSQQEGEINRLMQLAQPINTLISQRSFANFQDDVYEDRPRLTPQQVQQMGQIQFMVVKMNVRQLQRQQNHRYPSFTNNKRSVVCLNGRLNSGKNIKIRVQNYFDYFYVQVKQNSKLDEQNLRILTRQLNNKLTNNHLTPDDVVYRISNQGDSQEVYDFHNQWFGKKTLIKIQLFCQNNRNAVIKALDQIVQTQSGIQVLKNTFQQNPNQSFLKKFIRDKEIHDMRWLMVNRNNCIIQPGNVSVELIVDAKHIQISKRLEIAPIRILTFSVSATDIINQNQIPNTQFVGVSCTYKQVSKVFADQNIQVQQKNIIFTRVLLKRVQENQNNQIKICASSQQILKRLNQFIKAYDPDWLIGFRDDYVNLEKNEKIFINLDGYLKQYKYKTGYKGNKKIEEVFQEYLRVQKPLKFYKNQVTTGSITMQQFKQRQNTIIMQNSKNLMRLFERQKCLQKYTLNARMLKCCIETLSQNLFYSGFKTKNYIEVWRQFGKNKIVTKIITKCAYIKNQLSDQIKQLKKMRKQESQVYENPAIYFQINKINQGIILNNDLCISNVMSLENAQRINLNLIKQRNQEYNFCILDREGFLKKIVTKYRGYSQSINSWVVDNEQLRDQIMNEIIQKEIKHILYINCLMYNSPTYSTQLIAAYQLKKAQKLQIINQYIKLLPQDLKIIHFTDNQVLIMGNRAQNFTDFRKLGQQIQVAINEISGDFYSIRMMKLYRRCLVYSYKNSQHIKGVVIPREGPQEIQTIYNLSTYYNQCQFVCDVVALILNKLIVMSVQDFVKDLNQRAKQIRNWIKENFFPLSKFIQYKAKQDIMFLTKMYERQMQMRWEDMIPYIQIQKSEQALRREKINNTQVNRTLKKTKNIIKYKVQYFIDSDLSFLPLSKYYQKVKNYLKILIDQQKLNSLFKIVQVTNVTSKVSKKTLFPNIESQQKKLQTIQALIATGPNYCQNCKRIYQTIREYCCDSLTCPTRFDLLFCINQRNIIKWYRKRNQSKKQKNSIKK